MNLGENLGYQVHPSVLFAHAFLIFPFKTPKVCKDGVNRWTDNTWQVKSWMVKTKGMSGSDVDRYLQIKGDFDYV